MNAVIFPRALLTLFLAFAFPVASFAYWDVGIRVGFAPPEIPLYAQPPCPGPGNIWTPGYWAYSNDDEDYYWVPGTWVLAPSAGLYWTPGYWAVNDDEYEWNEGYWAPHVGFYGGINYGFGYFGVGFAGGYWRDRDFYYNRAVVNVTNVNVTNVYYSNEYNNYDRGRRVSFNGGDGVRARPTSTDLIAAREPHRGFTAPQRFQAESARKVPELMASVNHGLPTVAATPRPGLFNARNVEPARATGDAPMWRRNAQTPNRADNTSRPEASRPDASNRQSMPQQPQPAHAFNQQPMTRSTESQWTSRGGSNLGGSNPRGGDVMQRSAPPSRAPVVADYRRSEQQPAAQQHQFNQPQQFAQQPHQLAQPAPYRSAPAPAYRQAPTYAPPRAPQPAPRSENYGMPQRAAMPQQMPRNEPSPRGSPPAHGNGPDRNRS